LASNESISGITKIAERAFFLSMSKGEIEKLKKFDLFVAPPELKDYKIHDPEKAEELFEIGYRASIKKLEDKKL
jgi:NTE family protein